MNSSFFFLSVEKGEVRRWKARRTSAESVVTAPLSSFHFQASSDRSLRADTEIVPSAWLAAAYLSPAAQQGLQAGPEGIGRKPNHLCSGIMKPRNPAATSIHSALVLKAALKETRLLGRMPFRVVGQYLTGCYVGFKQTTLEYVTASASRNSCRAAACQAQAWGKTKSPINSLERGTRPWLQTRATATLSDRVQSEPAEEQKSKKGETFWPAWPVQNSSPGRKRQGCFCKDRSSFLA